MSTIDPRLLAVATALRSHRIEHDLSARQVAAELGVAPSTVCRLENGDNVDTRVLLRVLDYLDYGALFGPQQAPAKAYQQGWDDCAAAMRAAIDRTAPADVAIGDGA